MPKDPIQFQRMEGEFMHDLENQIGKLNRAGMGIYHTRPAPPRLNF